jgi:hypothetical protein
MLQLLWSHCRDIRVNLLEKTIKYSIPIYSEDGMIGKFIKAEIETGTLNLTFQRIDAKDQSRDLDKCVRKCTRTIGDGPCTLKE